MQQMRTPCGGGCDVVTRQPGLECDQGPGKGGRLAAPAARVWRSGWRRILETGRRDVGYGLSAVVMAPCQRRDRQWDDSVGSGGRVWKGDGGVVLDLASSCPRSFTVVSTAWGHYSRDGARGTKLSLPLSPMRSGSGSKAGKGSRCCPMGMSKSHTVRHRDKLCQCSQPINGLID